MKVYLAAPYAARGEMQSIAMTLELLGHEVTSGWIAATHDITKGTVDAATDHSVAHLRGQVADDLSDIDEAEAVVFFTAAWCMDNFNLHRHQTISGGRHVEVGYALAKNKLVIVLGEPENIFHRGACIIAGDWDEVMGLLYNDNEDTNPA